MDQDAVLDVPGRIHSDLQQTRFNPTVFTGFGVLLDANEVCGPGRLPFTMRFCETPRLILLVSETHRLHGIYGTKPLRPLCYPLADRLSIGCSTFYLSCGYGP